MKSKDTRTVEQKCVLRNDVERMLKAYPHASVHGHNEFDKGKACPSFNVQTDL